MCFPTAISLPIYIRESWTLGYLQNSFPIKCYVLLNQWTVLGRSGECGESAVQSAMRVSDSGTERVKGGLAMGPRVLGTAQTGKNASFNVTVRLNSI